jgi:hypothetical protein
MQQSASYDAPFRADVRGLETDADLKLLLERNYRRTTWTLIAAVVAIITSTISILATVASAFVLSGGLGVMMKD